MFLNQKILPIARVLHGITTSATIDNIITRGCNDEIIPRESHNGFVAIAIVNGIITVHPVSQISRQPIIPFKSSVKIINISKTINTFSGKWFLTVLLDFKGLKCSAVHFPLVTISQIITCHSKR